MNNKAKMSLRKAGMATALAVAMVLPCAALVGNAAGVEDPIEVSASRAVMHRYEIDNIQAGNSYFYAVPLDNRQYHEIGTPLDFGAQTVTYSVEEDNILLDAALRKAYETVNLTQTVSYNFSGYSLNAAFTTGYYEVVWEIEVKNVEFTVNEEVVEGIFQSIQSGRDAVPVKNGSWNLYVEYYRTNSQEGYTTRTLIASNQN